MIHRLGLLVTKHMLEENKYANGNIHIDELRKRTSKKLLLKKVLRFISILSIAIGGGMLGGLVTYLLLK